MSSVSASASARVSVSVSPPPLPSWNLAHTASTNPDDSSRASKAREWESQQGVLGRTEKSSLYKPKALLSLSTHASLAAHDAASEMRSAASNGDLKPLTVFGSESWHLRRTIDRGFACLLALQDARHLLDAKHINSTEFYASEPSSLPEGPLRTLRTDTMQHLVTLAACLGVSGTAMDPTPLLAVLSVAKGQVLLMRSLLLLSPSARGLLLPVLVQYLMNVPPTSVDAVTRQNRLSQTLVLSLMYHPPLPSPVVLANCLEAAMTGHTRTSLSVVLHDRPRAEALQALLQQGGGVCTQEAHPEAFTKWMHWQTNFVTLASAIHPSQAVA